MNKTRSNILLIITALLLALFLAACGGTQSAAPAAEPAVEPTKTRIPLEGEADSEESAPEQESEAAAEDPAEQPDQDNEEAAGGMRTFVIVPEESRASYLVDEEFFEDALSKLGINAGDVDVVGTTENVEGQIQVNLQDMANPLGQTVINADLSGLRTDQDRRDSWLQENGGGPQFGRFPLASFTATGIEGLPDSYGEGEEVQFTLLGDLTVRETTRPVSFDVTAVISGDTLNGTAETRLLMSELGITPPNFANTLSVADEFGIRVELVARES